jgi:hypothetical protein
MSRSRISRGYYGGFDSYSRYEYQHKWQSEVWGDFVANIEAQIRTSEENFG